MKRPSPWIALDLILLLLVLIAYVLKGHMQW